MKKSAIVVVINSLLIYYYVGGREDVYPDPDKVRTLSILCSLVLWLQVEYLRIYIPSQMYIHAYSNIILDPTLIHSNLM